MMSLVDKPDGNLEAAFTRCIEGETAHRQSRVSLVLVAAMAIAAFALGFALPLDAPHARRGQPIVDDDYNLAKSLKTVGERCHALD